VLRLEDELRKFQRRLERLERQMHDEVRNVHKHYRRDLVPYRAAETLPDRKARWTSTS
jgi:hypothetical protein